jgi:ElaB/YqjD/DUF883 family membrane-anchored ribosome-binding protein
MSMIAVMMQFSPHKNDAPLLSSDRSPDKLQCINDKPLRVDYWSPHPAQLRPHVLGAERSKPMATNSTTTAEPPAKKAPPARKAPAKKAKANGTLAKAKFSKAIEEAKAGAVALGHEAQAKAGLYRDQFSAKSEPWVEEAKDLASQAKERAGDLAVEGKAKASDALATLGKVVTDNAGTIDEKLGARYGDYARTAGRSMQETAAKIEAKDLNELGDDAKEFVRKSPGLAVGIAAVAGFFLARLFKGSAAKD